MNALPSLKRLAAKDVERHLANGGIVVDTRPFADFAASHIPGSVSNALRPGFATWLAVTLPADVPIVFVGDHGVDEDELVRQTLNVGHERLVGVLDGGIDTWRAAGNAVASTDLVGVDRLDGRIIDVRQHDEYAAGHLPGAQNVELGSIIDAVIVGPVTVMCGHGERAMTAASLLARAGSSDVRALDGGPEEWSSKRGQALTREP